MVAFPVKGPREHNRNIFARHRNDDGRGNALFPAQPPSGALPLFSAPTATASSYVSPRTLLAHLTLTDSNRARIPTAVETPHNLFPADIAGVFDMRNAAFRTKRVLTYLKFGSGRGSGQNKQGSR
jgi:hypothetical protein